MEFPVVALQGAGRQRVRARGGRQANAVCAAFVDVSLLIKSPPAHQIVADFGGRGVGRRRPSQPVVGVAGVFRGEIVGETGRRSRRRRRRRLRRSGSGDRRPAAPSGAVERANAHRVLGSRGDGQPGFGAVVKHQRTSGGSRPLVASLDTGDVVSSGVFGAADG
ncbi:MAG: hypothetical protein MPJ22_08105, partial [Pirellulales bacterium]|nr:hypothetical protein [Pirellulales bacterium]